VSFAASTPLALRKRNDPLNGFRQCDGDFPITIDSFSYSPIPLIAGQNATNHVHGEANAVVNQGALLRIMGIVNNTEQLFHELDYCKIFVEQNGLECPTEKGDFDFTASWFVDRSPTSPKNEQVEHNVRVYGM